MATSSSLIAMLLDSHYHHYDIDFRLSVVKQQISRSGSAHSTSDKRFVGQVSVLMTMTTGSCGEDIFLPSDHS